MTTLPPETLVAPGLSPGLLGAALRSARRVRSMVAEATWALVEPRVEPLRFASHRQRAERLRSVARRLCHTHGVTPIVRGTFPEGPAVIVSNHLSYLDAVLLAALHPVAPIAKAEVAGWPLIGPSMLGLGVSFVERGDPYRRAVVLRRALRSIRSGVSVLNFPEGTTSHGDDLLPFHRGIFGLARLAEVPVVPVTLRFEDRSLAWVGSAAFVPNYLRCTRQHRIRIDVHVGEPQGAEGDSPEALMVRVRNAMREQLLG